MAGAPRYGARMDWTTALSRDDDADAAAREAIAAVSGALGRAPQLVLAFLSRAHRGRARAVGAAIRRAWPGATLLGCTGGGVIGGGLEIEGAPGLALLAGTLSGVEIHPFHLGPGELDPGRMGPQAWHGRLGLSEEHRPGFVLLADPLTTDADRLATLIDRAFPGATKVGGLASGARPPERHALLLDDAVHEAGVVGIALVGDVALDAVVAQGCRPIGPQMQVTRAERNLVFELDGQPAHRVIEAVFATLSAEDKALFQRLPLVGLSAEPGARALPGEVLVRNVLGLDRERGAVGVSALVSQQQRLQLQVRHAASAAEELRGLLGRYRRTVAGELPTAALLFSCLGRGEAFYGEANHDSDLMRELLGPIPIGGFFCNGEIGPVHGRTRMHAYTSSIGLIRQTGWN